MTSVHRATFALVGLATVGPIARLHALDVSNPSYFRLVSGSLAGRQAKVFDHVQGVYIEGAWANGRTIANQPYLVSHPRKPAQKYEIFFDDEGFAARGVQIRALGAPSGVPYFEGVFQKVYHPFMRAQVATPHEGTYHTGLGLDYKGRFQYMGAKGHEAGMVTMGYFIFYGERIDHEDGTSETGLFVSDATVGGAAIRFVAADPSYLAVLQEQYQRDLQIAQGDFGRQRTRQNWARVFSVLTELAQVTNVGSGGSGLASGRNEVAMNLVQSLFANSTDDKPISLNEIALKGIASAGAGKLTDNKQLAEKLAEAVVKGLDKAVAAETETSVKNPE